VLIFPQKRTHSTPLPCSTQRTLPSNLHNTTSTHVLYSTTALQPYIVLRCKHYLGAIGACGCFGWKSCCNTCCVGAACWDGFGVLADLGIGSFGNCFTRFAVFTLTPSMSRASSAIVLANNLSTSKRTVACSLSVMSRIAFNARCRQPTQSLRHPHMCKITNPKL